MKITIDTTTKGKHKFATVVREFDSLSEFFNWITTHPFNKHFNEPKNQHSISGSESFTYTKSFDDAVDLFRNGWDKGAKDIQKQLTDSKIKTPARQKQRPTYSMAGYQACVPRYLQGVPESMITKKQVNVKQKVVTLTKSVSYSGGTSTKTMIDESVKAIQIVNRLEAHGIRCNLNIILGTTSNNHTELCKIRIKSANERLNVSKLAFPLANPSMLRRLLFRYIEVADTITKDFVWDYGAPVGDFTLRKTLAKSNEVLLPAFFHQNVEEINSIDDIK